MADHVRTAVDTPKKTGRSCIPVHVVSIEHDELRRILRINDVARFAISIYQTAVIASFINCINTLNDNFQLPVTIEIGHFDVIWLIV